MPCPETKMSTNFIACEASVTKIYSLMNVLLTTIS